MSKSTLGAIAGAAIGFFFGGPTGAKIGWTLGSFLFAEPGPDTQGPRLDSLTVESLDYGASIPRIYRKGRIAGFRMWQRAIIEKSHTEEVGGKGGGGGATHTTYSYYGTFAIGLCEGEIAGIRKIWADSILIYDAGSGADVQTVIASNEASTLFTVYPGSATQEPDSLIQATQGAANTPAYRHLAYIVFDELPLEKHGNRIPNITCEVVENGGLTKSVNEIASVVAGDKPYDVCAVNDYAYVLNRDDHNIQIYDVGDIENPVSLATVSSSVYPALTKQAGNYIYVAHAAVNDLVAYSLTNPLNPVASTPVDITGNPRDLYIDGDYLYVISNSTDGILEIYSITSPYSPALIGSLRGMGDGVWSISVSGDYLYVEDSINDKINIIDISDKHNPSIHSTLSVGDDPKSTAIVGDYLYVMCSVDDTIEVYDISIPATPTIETTLALTSASYNGVRLVAGENYLYLCMHLVSTGLKIIDISNPADPVEYATDATVGTIRNGHIENDILYAADETGRLEIFSPLEEVAPSTRKLSYIVADLCEKAGLTASDIDVIDLTDDVDGYIISSNMSARAAIEVLQKAYFFDGAEYGNKINFVKRGGSSIKTIAQDDLGAAEYGSDHYALKLTRMQDSELPSDVSVGYINGTRDYEIGVQRAQRINYSVPNTVGQELAIVMSDDKALQIADVTLYNAYAEREKFEFSLTNDHIDLNPTDVVTVQHDGDSRVVRLVKLSYGDVIECEAVSEDPQVYSSNATAAAESWTGQSISITGTTRVEYMDIPILRNADNDAGLYYSAAGYYAAWTGAQIFKSLDGGVTYNPVDAIFVAGTIGIATTKLNDADPTLWDRDNTLTVKLVHGSLSTATEGNVIRGSNYMLVGSEVIQFSTATLNADGTYTIDTLLRGRRGTEWATDSHAIGDRVVLLTESTLGRFDAIHNTERHYKAVTLGQYVEGASGKSVTNTGVSLTPFSPAYVAGSRDGSNNLTITWMRRSRYIGAPLGSRPIYEESESYEVDVMGGSTVLRTIATSSETASYTAAQQTTDGLTPGDPVSIIVYQLSATVGRGYGTEATV